MSYIPTLEQIRVRERDFHRNSAIYVVTRPNDARGSDSRKNFSSRTRKDSHSNFAIHIFDHFSKRSIALIVVDIGLFDLSVCKVIRAIS